MSMLDQDASRAIVARLAQTWPPIDVAYSGGRRSIAHGARWRDGLTGSTWEVVEPTGEATYSPSGLGGTRCFWCKPVGEISGDAKHWFKDARADGCVSFCGDSIAAGLLPGDEIELPSWLRKP